MKNFLANEIVLVRYPFSDLSSSKIRPAVIISSPHLSQDLIIVPVTSRIIQLQDGEFVLEQWKAAGLNVASAIKRGIYTISKNIVIKTIGSIHEKDRHQLKVSVLSWLCWK
jgi:mRNA interferase MazF